MSTQVVQSPETERTARRRVRGVSSARVWAGAVVALAILALPFYSNAYDLRVATTIAMIAVLATSWNVIAGYTGYLAFGNIVFFGLGAYGVAAGVTKLHLPLPLAFVLGILAAVAVAVAAGLVLLRLRGHYFAIATLALSLVALQVFTNISWLGGTQGIFVPIPSMGVDAFGQVIYYSMLGALALAIAAVYVISRTRIGFALRAIRADEAASAMLGINTTYYKILAFTVSGIFPAIAGGIYVEWVSFINPGLVFDQELNLKFLVAALVGGMGTILGPTAGAIVMGLITEVALSATGNWHLGVLGLAVVLVVMFVPNGVMSLRERAASVPHLIRARRGGVRA